VWTLAASCAAVIALANGRATSSLEKAVVFAPGEISTGEYESHPCFSADGKTLYYLKSTPQFDHWTIVVSRLEGGHWSRPEVAPFSGRWSDADPWLSPDGRRLYFISDRPVSALPKSDLDLWFVEQTASGWGEPVHLDAPLNSAGNEWFPSLARDGTLYFGSDRAGGKGRTDIYAARFADGKYAEPENLGDGVNSRFDEFEACLMPDESALIVMSARAGGRGQGDLYVSRKRDGQWSALELLDDPVSTAGFEVGPHVSPDGTELFFSSTRAEPFDPNAGRLDYSGLSKRLSSPGNGLGDIYRISLSFLKTK
jgi:Tol biopolymer transport system component